jgi:hypothetical protein
MKTKIFAIALSCALLTSMVAGVGALPLSLLGDVVIKTKGQIRPLSCLSADNLSKIDKTGPIFSTDGFKFIDAQSTDGRALFEKVLGIINPDSNSLSNGKIEALRRFDSFNNTNSSELNLFFYYQVGQRKSLTNDVALNSKGLAAMAAAGSTFCGDNYISSLDNVKLSVAELRIVLKPGVNKLDVLQNLKNGMDLASARGYGSMLFPVLRWVQINDNVSTVFLTFNTLSESDNYRSDSGFYNEILGTTPKEVECNKDQQNCDRMVNNAIDYMSFYDVNARNSNTVVDFPSANNFTLGNYPKQ